VLRPIRLEAWVSKQQLATMNEMLKEAHLQNVAQQQAALSFEVVPSFRTKYGLAITIHNTGRMKATLLAYRIRYEQKVSYGQTFTRERTVDLRNKSENIGGGYIYSLEIATPPLPQYISERGEWSVMATLIVRYDNGFGDEDGVRGCFSFNPRSGEGGQTCSWVTSVDIMSDDDAAAAPKNK
jgi:hypothetical protein